MLRLLVLCTFCLGFSTLVRAEPDWQLAQKEFRAGKLEDSLRIFMENPSEDASYFYNIGTIHYKLGHQGLAVAYLEKANRLRPHDPDIQFNLNLARSNLAQLIGHDHLDQASTSMEAAADRIPLDEVRGTIGLIGFILALFWCRRYWKTRNLEATLLRPAGVIGLVALLICVGFYGAQRLAQSRPPAVAIDTQVIRSGPGDQYLELSRIQPGMKVRVLGPTAKTPAPVSVTTTGDPGAAPTGTAQSAAAGSATPPTTPQAAPAQQPAEELWRQVRYTPEEVGWVRASSLLLL